MITICLLELFTSSWFKIGMLPIRPQIYLFVLWCYLIPMFLCLFFFSEWTVYWWKRATKVLITVLRRPVTLVLAVFSLTFGTSVYEYDYIGVLFHQSMWNDLYFSLLANFSLKSIFTCLLPGSLCFELLVHPFVLKYCQSLITWCISWRQKRERSFEMAYWLRALVVQPWRSWVQIQAPMYQTRHDLTCPCSDVDWLKLSRTLRPKRD